MSFAPEPALPDFAPVVFGCAGRRLAAAEREFFSRVRPLGFILFARNVATPDQVRDLVAEVRSAAGHDRVLVLIDQEGGRVARLGPPHWRAYPAAAAFGNRFGAEPETAISLARESAARMGGELAALGINVDCAPVADLCLPGAHDIIGDRAFGSDPGAVAVLGRAVAEGLLRAGVLPVVKHTPGHGRARCDSHLALPVVDEPRAVLEETDFVPFRLLADLPVAMTAHVTYADVDALAPATLSRTVVQECIRGSIGFDGLLVTDDISMGALAGPLGHRTEAALDAGCDVVLHCNGRMEEMVEVAAALRPGARTLVRRVDAALAAVSTAEDAVQDGG